MFTAIAIVVLWYRIPVDPLRKSILLGFVPYLLVFAVASSIIGAANARLFDAMNYGQIVAYVALLLYWNRVVWQRSAIIAPPSSPSTEALSV